MSMGLLPRMGYFNCYFKFLYSFDEISLLKYWYQAFLEMLQVIHKGLFFT